MWKNGNRERRRDGGATLLLEYRPPYRWEQILDFLALRAIPGVETVEGGEYRRTVRWITPEQEPVHGWIVVGNCAPDNALNVVVSSALTPVLPGVTARIRRLFDLDCDPLAVYETLAPMNGIRPGLCVPGTRLPGCFDAFEMAVRAVLGQQITVKGARTLAGRLANAYGASVDTGMEGLTHVFPSPGEIAALSGSIGDYFGPLGITSARSNTIRKLAEAFADGVLDFSRDARPEEEIRKLTAIPGIGVWTAQYLAMRAMGWSDAFPHTDYGVKKALAPKTEKEILAVAEPWRPWRAYATINLWNSL